MWAFYVRFGKVLYVAPAYSLLPVTFSCILMGVIMLSMSSMAQLSLWCISATLSESLLCHSTVV